MDNEQMKSRGLWLLIGILSLGYGFGGGLSNYSDHGLTIPVLMQLGGGLIGSIFAFIQARKK